MDRAPAREQLLKLTTRLSSNVRVSSENDCLSQRRITLRHARRKTVRFDLETSKMFAVCIISKGRQIKHTPSARRRWRSKLITQCCLSSHFLTTSHSLPRHYLNNLIIYWWKWNIWVRHNVPLLWDLIENVQAGERVSESVRRLNWFADTDNPRTLLIPSLFLVSLTKPMMRLTRLPPQTHTREIESDKSL